MLRYCANKKKKKKMRNGISEERKIVEVRSGGSAIAVVCFL